MKNYFLMCAALMAAFCLNAPIMASPEPSMAERVANHRVLRSSVEKQEGKFAALKPGDKSKILRAQDRIFELLEGKSATAELSSADRTRMDNAESEIANLVASLDPPAASAKVKCSYEARIGSNRKERICRKVGSSDSMRAREDFRRLQKQ